MKHDWKVKRFGDICESDLGKTLNQSKDKGELYPYLCSINVLWDKFDFTVVKQARFDDKELERYTVRKGDLLICEGGDIGRAAIWNQDNPILYQNALHRVRLINNDVIPRFVMLFLKYLKLSGVLDTRYGKGVTIKHLVKSSLLSIPIPVPERAEQERIVGELDCLSGIIAAKRAQLRELDTLAQSIFYTMFGDPITNDKGWQTKKLGDVALIVGGSTPSTREETNWNGDLNWVTPAELNGTLYYGETQRKITTEGARGLELLPVGTVLLSSRAPIGKLAITTVPMYCNQGFKNVVCGESINNIYVYYYLLATIENVKALGVGATFKEVSKRAVENYHILVPSIDLQKQFAEKIENIELQKELITKSIKETEDLFNSRMDYYFN